jgi:hypothetical protein
MTDSTIQRQRLFVIFWLLATVLGLLYTWCSFYDLIHPDNISYLDRSSGFLMVAEGQWENEMAS